MPMVCRGVCFIKFGLYMSISVLRVAGRLVMLSVALMQAYAVLGQDPDYAAMAGRADVFSSGDMLGARSLIMPYASREEALAGGRSAYVVELDDWVRDTVAEGVRFTARFKVRYTWNNRAVLLRVENLPSSFAVEVNGNPEGYCQAGAGRTEFDITDQVHIDYNTVTVTVFRDAIAEVVESGRGHEPYGIGGAWVVSQPSVRIHDIFASTAMVGGEGILNLDVVMQSRLLNPKEYAVECELLDAGGGTVAVARKSFKSGMLSTDTVRLVMRVKSPRRWNHETPELYTLLVSTSSEGRTQEWVPVRVGFREVGHADGGLLVDGLPVPLSAVYLDDAEQEDAVRLAELKRAGYNCLVTRAPQPDDFYSLCDSLGLYVFDGSGIDASSGPESIAVGGNPNNDPVWLDSYMERVRRVYMQSHLHPCVVAYSPVSGRPDGYCVYEGYVALKRFDAGRPVFYDGAEGQWNNDICAGKLFGPAIPRPQERVSTALESYGGYCSVVLSNNMSLGTVQGTYKIRLRSRRRTLSVKEGDFRIIGGGTLHIPVSLPEEGVDDGRIETELHIRREAAAGDDSRKVADMYDLIETVHALP